ncbi:MAG: hypothetical protein ACYDH6_19700 [Acidimicrobiales bacterium]
MTTDVVTQHYDNSRTGANLTESHLTVHNVNTDRFGRTDVRPVWGSVYAQPLLLCGVTFRERQRNVVYIATMHNSVYALDADHPSRRALWGPVSLGPPIPLPDDNIGWGQGYRDIDTEIGIISTPVISRRHHAIYLVAATKDGDGYHHHLHALDLATGREKPGSPVRIEATVRDTTFESNRHNQRSALMLLNDIVYFAFASYGDQQPYHGWVFGYHVNPLSRAAVFCTTPGGSEGGIWMAGQGPATDGDDVFVMTGNGAGANPDLSCAFVKLASDSLGLQQWFAPTNRSALNGADLDLGSGGPLLLPDTNLIVGGGKDGRLFLLDRGNLGNAADDTKAKQIFQATATGNQPGPAAEGDHHIHGAPVYWHGPMGRWIYVGGETDYLKAFAFDQTTKRFQPTTPVSISHVYTPARSMPGAILSLSAQGSNAGTGILWASYPATIPNDDDGNQRIVQGTLHAFDATDLSRELWSSEQNFARDDVGACAKFVPPVVANGRVILPSFCGPYHKQTLGETAIAGPALANANDDQLVLGWTGTDSNNSLNILLSMNGADFYGKQTLHDSSGHGPALAFGDNTLFIAWTGTDSNHSLNVSQSTNLQNFHSKVTLPENSGHGPSIAYANGVLFIAWTGTDSNHSLNVACSADGQNFTNKVTLGESSIDGPCIAFADGKLYLLWTGTDSNNSLNVLQSTDGQNWSGKVTLTESSHFRPILARHHSRYLMWTGEDSRLNLRSTDYNVGGYHGKQTYRDSANDAPALVTFRGRGMLAWTGTDPNHQLNVAPFSGGHVSFYGTLRTPRRG